MKAAQEAQTQDSAMIEREAARAVARKLKLELAQIDRRIEQSAVEAGRTADEARANELLAEREELIKRKELLPLLLRSAQVRCLQPLADDLQARADAASKAHTEAEREVTAATTEYDAAAAAFERAAARLKAAEIECRQRSERFYRESGIANEFALDLHRLAQGIELIHPSRFEGLC